MKTPRSIEAQYAGSWDVERPSGEHRKIAKPVPWPPKA
jgi:hypothetical protein